MSKWKWNPRLLVLTLSFGVMACSAPAAEPEAADQAPAEKVAEEAPVKEVATEAPKEAAVEKDAAVEAPACGTFSFVVDAVYPEDAAGGMIDDQAKVTSVNRPGDAAFDTMTVDNGDGVQGTTYAPDADDPDVGIVAGTTYNMFMITQPDDTQAFIVWSPNEPIWQDLLKTASAVVAGIGSPGPNTLMRGDDVQISVQKAQEGGIDVTLDVCRAEGATSAGAAAADDATTKDADAEDAAMVTVDTDVYYQLQTVLTESDNKCLEGQGGAESGTGAVMDGAGFMNDCKAVTGQLWKFVPAADAEGYYRLQNQIGEEKDLCAEGNRMSEESVLGGAFVMMPCEDVSGQLWKLQDAGDGYYRLQSQFLEAEGKCLESQDGTGDVLGGAAFMDDCQDVTGQVWRLVPQK